MNEEIKDQQIPIEEEIRWYVVNTYSGHENKAKDNLEKRIESMGLSDIIFKVLIAEHEETEIKDGKKVTKIRNTYPGYVLIQMKMTDEAWFIVRNTPGVTGFIGSSGGGTKPFPLSPEEVEPILRTMGIKNEYINLNFEVGDFLRVVDGPFLDSIGKVESIDLKKETVTILSNFLGREAPLTVDLSVVKRIEDVD